METSFLDIFRKLDELDSVVYTLKNTSDGTALKTKYIVNKNAFQWDAYHPLVDHIPASTVAGGTCPEWYLLGAVPGGWVYLAGGVPAQGGVPARDVPDFGCTCWGCTCQRGSPCDRMTDTCKDITFANFVCGWLKVQYQIY